MEDLNDGNAAGFGAVDERLEPIDERGNVGLDEIGPVTKGLLGVDHEQGGVGGHNMSPVAGPETRLSSRRANRLHLQETKAGQVTPTQPRRSRPPRSEEHTSELQSRQYLVCRLLLD